MVKNKIIDVGDFKRRRETAVATVRTPEKSEKNTGLAHGNHCLLLATPCAGRLQRRAMVILGGRVLKVGLLNIPLSSLPKSPI